MGITSKNNLKGYFNKGDRPRESQFVDLIDSFVHINDNSSPLTSSHDISSSGIITAEDIIIGDDLTVGDNINLGSGGKLNFNGPTSEQYILGQNNGIEIVGAITASNDISSSGTITANSFIGDGSNITGVTGEWDGSLNGSANITGSLIVSGGGNITASGNISSSLSSTGSFGRLICTSISASTGQFDANTIFIGGSPLSKTDVDELKDVEVKRKSTTGLPIKRLRGFTSASTFIDLEATNVSAGDRIDIKVADTFEALSLSTARISLGPKETVPLELTGSLDIRPANNTQHLFHGKYQISGKHAEGNSTLVADNNVVSFAVTGSNSYSGSSYTANFTSMSMDISQGGFFGLAVQGSTHASNLANLADFLIDFNQSGSTNFEGGDTTISQSVDNTLIVSGGNTNFNTNVNVDVTDATSSFDISGSDGSVTFEVSGGNVVITSEFTQSGEAVFEGGTTTINGTAQTQSLIVSGGQIQFEVEDSGSSFEISGSEGNTLNVSGGNVVITSEFTQSGEAVFEGGTTTFGTSSVLPSGFTSESLGTGSSEVVIEGDLEITGSIIQNFTNNVPISSSLTLTQTVHGLGRQLFVRSGSAAIAASSGIGAMPEGLPIQSGIYRNTPPSGEMTLTLPSATIGLSFHIINHNSPSNVAPYVGNQYGPSLKLNPSGSNKFIYGAGGSAGVTGKAILNHSSSNNTGDYVVVSCVSQSHWMIQQMGGTWVDEA